MRMNLKYVAELPGGLLKNGARIQDVELRPLNGEDEVFLFETGESLTPAARVTALLARCIVRLGSDLAVTQETVRSLTIGDREALLLHLRLLTFGDRMPCVLTCPAKGCHEKMNLDLFVRNLLVDPYERLDEWHDLPLNIRGKDYKVSLRIPNGLDQELLAKCAIADSVAAQNLLLQRCVRFGFPEMVDQSGIDSWPPELVDAIGRKISELDPQAEILLNMHCAACGRAFAVEFDAGSYFYQELSTHISYLYREVHTIARSYHWSQTEILGMTPKNRSIYLTLLAGEDVRA